MVQEDKKQKKDFRNIPGIPGGDDKSPRKRPGFNPYWIYAIIAAVLIASQFFSFTPDAQLTNELDLKNKMLAQGDVEKLYLVENKRLVRVYIKKDSLNKATYSKIKKTDGPHYEFRVTRWEGFDNRMEEFYKKN